MVRFNPQPQDHYAVAVFEGRRKMTGGIFATRAEAEAYAAAFYGGNYTVTATCPSYDRIAQQEYIARYTGRPYRQGDAIETDPDTNDWMSN